MNLEKLMELKELKEFRKLKNSGKLKELKELKEFREFAFCEILTEFCIVFMLFCPRREQFQCQFVSRTFETFPMLVRSTCGTFITKQLGCDVSLTGLFHSENVSTTIS